MAFRSDSGDGALPAAAEVAVRAAVTGTFVTAIEWVAETGSTNTDLLQAAAAGAPHGVVRVADHQTAGRGRRDRTWTAAPGDALLVSVLLRPKLPPNLFGVFTAAMAVAATEACRAAGALGVAIKWPNDLVVGAPGERRKLAGILAQSQVAPDEATVVVGMGLNLRSARLGELGRQAVALDELCDPPDRVGLLSAVLVRLDEWLRAIDADDATGLWERYVSLSATVGTVVRAQLDDEVIVGTAAAVTAAGSLVIESAGTRREVVAADVVSLR